MYRQRKRDLNLKPNRQLDKRSSRGMIYENEELRMRTIAICEDVDKGQSDIKKLRKENDHLKREIWGLRDECEKLEEILKKVCISANIPEFQLDVSSQKKGGDDEDSDDDDEEDEEDDGSCYGAGSDYLKTDDSERHRKTSGTSVLTFDSDVGSCMTEMFSDDPGGGEIVAGGGDRGFAADDPGSVIMNPECSTSAMAAVAAEVICHPQPGFSTEPEPSTSFAHSSQPWSHPTAVPPDLECVKEETESAVSSPLNPSPIQAEHSKVDLDNIVLPDPSLIMLPSCEIGELQQQDGSLASPVDGRKTPVIQITPASSPAFNENGPGTEPQSPTDINSPSTDPESVHSVGCITVVPKTFKVTSEIVVGEENGETNVTCEKQGISKSEELPRKILKWPQTNQDLGPLQSDHIILNQASLSGGFQNSQRRSSYFPPASTTQGTAQTLPPTMSNIHHRSFGMLSGCSSCCCAHDDPHLIGGYQSEPSLHNTMISPNSEHLLPNFFDPFQCCRGPAPSSIMTPLTMRSVWNTVDKNIVIGFYGVSGGGAGGSEKSIEPNVQEIIDELEAQFDPTLENIQGIRLIPGRIFISLKNASLVKLFLTNFKNDLVLRRKNTQQRIRIHFIEGATQKLTTTLVLSGIPQELSDLTVISSLNRFGQVVAPLERRNYKGVDISERIAQMHLVVGEESLPDCMNVNGYNIRIKVEKHQDQVIPIPLAGEVAPTRKYGFIPPVSTVLTANTTTTNTSTPSQQVAPTTNPVSNPNPTAPAALTLNPHKPVTRSSSSAPRLETPAPGTLTCPLPTVEQKRQSSVCAVNIPADQHPSKLLDKLPTPSIQQKVTIANQTLSSQQTIQGSSTPTLSAHLQPPTKKPLARLLVSSPGSFTASPPMSPSGGETASAGGGLKGFCRSFDPRRVPSAQSGAASSHPTLTPSSSYSPRLRRKSSVQFAGNAGKRGKREPLPWCGCWGVGCGN